MRHFHKQYIQREWKFAAMWTQASQTLRAFSSLVSFLLFFATPLVPEPFLFNLKVVHFFHEIKRQSGYSMLATKPQFKRQQMTFTLAKVCAVPFFFLQSSKQTALTIFRLHPIFPAAFFCLLVSTAWILSFWNQNNILLGHFYRTPLEWGKGNYFLSLFCAKTKPILFAESNTKFSFFPQKKKNTLKSCWNINQWTDQPTLATVSHWVGKTTIMTILAPSSNTNEGITNVQGLYRSNKCSYQAPDPFHETSKWSIIDHVMGNSSCTPRNGLTSTFRSA